MARADSWFKINADILDDFRAQKMSPAAFRREFLAAIGGNPSALSQLVKPDRGKGRLPWVQWAALRSLVFKRDDYTCRYCARRGGRLECDHVQPLSRGGLNDESNLATACYPCNRNKGTKTLEEWRNDANV